MRRAIVPTRDVIQYEWLVSKAVGFALQVGCGEKVIGGVINTDLNKKDRRVWGQCSAVCDVSALPFPNGIFDSVVSSHLLQGLKNVPLAFREMARVLKPGGKMAHVLPDHLHAPKRLDCRRPYDYCHWPNEGVKDVRETLRPVLEGMFVELSVQSFEEFDFSMRIEAVRC